MCIRHKSLLEITSPHGMSELSLEDIVEMSGTHARRRRWGCSREMYAAFPDIQYPSYHTNILGFVGDSDLRYND